jgi:hypothetical protein
MLEEYFTIVGVQSHIGKFLIDARPTLGPLPGKK